jgi:hypothetical protein
MAARGEPAGPPRAFFLPPAHPRTLVRALARISHPPWRFPPRAAVFNTPRGASARPRPLPWARGFYISSGYGAPTGIHPGAIAPPLLIQEGSSGKGSPPQMRRGGALGDGVVLNRKCTNSGPTPSASVAGTRSYAKPCMGASIPAANSFQIPPSSSKRGRARGLKPLPLPGHPPQRVGSCSENLIHAATQGSRVTLWPSASRRLR